jgi:methyl-accepting chemotaxis protein
MKILGKLAFMMLALTAGFVSVIVIIFSINRTTQELEGLRFHALTIVKDSYQLTDAIKAVLAMNKPLSELNDSLNNALTALSSDLASLPKQPGTAHLESGLRDEIQNTVETWKLVQSTFNRTGEGIKYVLDSAEITPEEKTGLLHIRRNLEVRGEDTSMLLFKIRTTQTYVESLDTSLREFVVETLSGINQRIDTQAQSFKTRALFIAMAVSFVLLAAAFILSVTFARSIARRLRSIEDTMRSVAAKDFTRRAEVRSRDEISNLARHINSVLDTLGGFLREVGAAVSHVDAMKDTLASSTNQSTAALNESTATVESMRGRCQVLERNITGSSEAVAVIGREVQGLAREIESQTASITTTTTAIEEMAASINSVSRLSTERKDRTSNLLLTVQESGRKVAETNDVIRQVSREIDSILEAISVINGVAAQTNLLSMNAAIESAHAGDAGRGFAVVANEIRKLAESTTANAKRIGASLKSITTRIRQALEAADRSYRSFDEINVFITEFAHALDEISGSMNELSTAAAEVLKASNVISEATMKVNTSSHEINQRTSDIQSAMKDSQQISNEISAGMTELEKGSREILTSMVEVTKIAETTRERMIELRKTVVDFKS